MGVPLVLHYHSVGDVARGLDPDNLVIEPDRLRFHLRSVTRLRRRFVPLAVLVETLVKRRPAGDLCALTFDDGAVDNLTLLPPILREFGAPATVFACPGLLGQPHPSFLPRAGIRLMTAEELQELSKLDGFEIGSHTTRHLPLDDASAEQAMAEMSESKAALEDLLGCPVTSFAYPRCGYSPACPDAARRAGYRCAVTCGRRGSWDPYELRRTSPDRLDSRLTMWLRARNLYDPLWSSLPGRAMRRVLRPIRHPQSVRAPDEPTRSAAPPPP